ncbi:MAG: hypothetical protein AAFQ22_12165 [Pseudomonadota bacterium]
MEELARRLEIARVPDPLASEILSWDQDRSLYLRWIAVLIVTMVICMGVMFALSLWMGGIERLSTCEKAGMAPPFFFPLSMTASGVFLAFPIIIRANVAALPNHSRAMFIGSILGGGEPFNGWMIRRVIEKQGPFASADEFVRAWSFYSERYMLVPLTACILLSILGFFGVQAVC